MNASGPIVAREGIDFPYTVLRAVDDWGFLALDLVGPPRRFWGDEAGGSPPTVELGVDARRALNITTPAAQLDESLGGDDNWSARSRRSIARLWAHYLICEDPQRRLDARAVSTLAHQISLVRHVLDTPHLARVLIADEVGLGKTVEVGLLLKELFEVRPELRVLYLAPARLVSNVRQEFDRLGIYFRQWTADESDANLNDPKVIASIHRSVHERHFDRIIATPPWDVLVVDECHHLSDWAPGGGDPKQKYRLVQRLIERQHGEGRVLFLSGTPHQGNIYRFENLLNLLRGPGEPDEALAGRVIFRTKDDVRDWNDRPLFPRRQVNEPIVIDLGPSYREWIEHIHDFFSPSQARREASEARRRAAGWRCAQALQWAASSPQAGLGYLVRQAIRAGRTLDSVVLRAAVSALRPYRLGPANEAIERLFDRMTREVEQQWRDADVEDMEDFEGIDPRTGAELDALLDEGLAILGRAADEKWDVLRSRVLTPSGDEKVVLFAQPIETVTAVASYLERTTGERPALILGGQDDLQRRQEVERFRDPDGPKFLVSSRAGGEGINLQVARRLVHLDVPWNPMEMEQRVGRVHRFGSRRTILVDTLVVKDSREADAYRVARERLALIAGTMVDRERFEGLFARVMCLVPPADLLGVLANQPLAPLGHEDQEQIAALVRAGYEAWAAFHVRFAEQQRILRRQDPGLATWDDLDQFLRQFAGASPAEGFRAQRFEVVGDCIEPVEDPVSVLVLTDGQPYACGDGGGAPVVGPAGVAARSLGLNLAPIAETLRRNAFPRLPSGAAHLRWSVGESAPASLPFGVLAFLRQTFLSRGSSWVERGSTLWVYLITADADPLLVLGEAKARLLRSLFSASVRLRPASSAPLIEKLLRSEAELAFSMRPPDDRERALNLRHAVSPIFAAIVEA
jgi:superfamily II DNA or RNA helicase